MIFLIIKQPNFVQNFLLEVGPTLRLGAWGSPAAKRILVYFYA